MEQQFIINAKAKSLGISVKELLQLVADRIVADDSSVEHDVNAIVMELTEDDIKQSAN
ncbi:MULTISPECIES: hypothetical protein [Vibrio]|uniref:hypothetical protein n=1 Tax=Vibrio TaxID=662 RepID=UPI00040B751C|nr:MULTISPECIES: hypothetical protein [Vibrio]EGX6964198.1 hypothetical protein [Vibrio alginolyticus]HCG7523050.1 hypothetical protein [Vibrio parahaemolyticus]ELB2849865.1 hypothetical protein [Vibrio alginolyticus]HBC3525595.1 hypothetical protein [Vibrio alginolyticus]HCH1894792.1 hypothetical protein [Vibrio parahaemolyticus]